MNLSEKNKQFMLNYFREMYRSRDEGSKAFQEAMNRLIKDEKLINHILFFTRSFPSYRLVIDYLVAEGDQVFVKANFVGRHEGDAEDIPATNQQVNVPFALGYKIFNEQIVDFWAIANEMEFFEQLGLSREQVDVRKEKVVLDK
jgi:hypothetical protein